MCISSVSCRYPYGPVKLLMNALIILLCVKRDGMLPVENAGVFVA